MKILFATSECSPFSKSGGLADVAYSLPPALKATGDQVYVVTPLYRCVKEKYGDKLTFLTSTEIEIGDRRNYCGVFKGTLNGVNIYFIDNEDMFNRGRLYGYDDDGFRFAFFSRAIIELLDKFEFVPEVIHCNDWETAPVILYLKNDQSWKSCLRGIKTIFTIHNIAYQGQFGAAELERTFGLPSGWYQGGLGYEYEGRHDINLMKGAMLMADAVSTVSPTYAREIHLEQYGMGLQGVANMVEYKMYGILNGIDMDLYNPAKDTRIAKNFSATDPEGKKECKRFIQEKFGLNQEHHWPLLGFVARLNEQKGIELIKEILPEIMGMGVQMIVFGQGDQHYIDYFNWAKATWPGQFGFSSDYSEDGAAEIFAGADMYLMPSRFEPCGLSQMMAMRYGTIPLVHATGGLKDSVRSYNEFDGIGDGFSFQNYDSRALFQAILFAVKIYFGDRPTFKELSRRCMLKDLSWNKSADQYNRMYSDICDGGSGADLSFDEAYKKLKAAYKKHDNALRKKYNWENFPEDFHLAVQIHVKGRGDGVMYMEFFKDHLDIEPYSYDNADCKISASFDNLYGMITGKLSAQKLFMNGQLKMTGNLSKGVALRHLLGE